MPWFSRDTAPTLAVRRKTIRGVVVVMFVTLGKEAVSVISMRPASKYERKLYAEY